MKKYATAGKVVVQKRETELGLRMEPSTDSLDNLAYKKYLRGITKGNGDDNPFRPTDPRKVFEERDGLRNEILVLRDELKKKEKLIEEYEKAIPLKRAIEWGEPRRNRRSPITRDGTREEITR